MKKKVKKKMSLLLILTMLMSLLPTSASVLAAESNIQLVESPVYGGITTGQMIYFGQYTKNDDNKAPIQWRVMGVEDGNATLISKDILEYRRYDSSIHKNWSGSEICNYLNNDFLTTAFKTVEQGYIVTYSNVQEHDYLEANTFTPNQKIVLPSVNEVKAGGDFGWNQNSDRAAENAEGFRGSPDVDRDWWLRSPGDYASTATFVNFDGCVEDYCHPVETTLGVRPALKLNLPSVLFTSDASGTGRKTGTPDSRLNSVADTNNEKKLTLIDQYNVSTNPTGQNIHINSDTYKYIENQATEIEINYSNATIGTDQYLSAMITDNSGALKYYGPIKSLTADESRTARVTIPSDFKDNWKLKIFTEQLNGNYQTDYASVPVEVTLQKVPDPLPQVSQGDKLYFGQYTKSDNNKAPILWRVMEKDVLSETVTLMSENILEYRQYDPSVHNNWSGSEICNYLNNDFLTTAFTTGEQGYISTYSDGQEHGYLETNTFTPNQKIVLPSVNEVESGGDFGWSQDSDRKAQNAVGYRGTRSNDKVWWLRSPGGYGYGAGNVAGGGDLSNRGAAVHFALGVRPALKLNLSSVRFTSVTDITAPAALTNVPNGISIENLKSQLPTIVSAETSDSTKNLNISWDLSTISYNPNLKEEQTFSIPGTVELPEGLVKLSNSITPHITISVTVDAAVAPTITTTSLASGTVGVAYSQTLDATGDSPITWSIESGSTLPTGVTLNSATGVISGTPTTVGTSNFTVKATNGVNPDATKSLSIIINAAPVAPTITTTSLSSGAVGTAYSQTLAATGDSPITWSIESGTLPQGINLNGTTGVISGTPTTVGTSNFTVRAANGVNPDATKALSITIDAVPTYTVTFDSNGGSATAPISSITNGSTITLPIPTKSNYTFKGWFEGTNTYTNKTPITKDVTLVANWEQNTSGGGGSGSGGSSGGVAPTIPPATPTTPAPAAQINPVSTEAIKKAEEAIQKLTETEKQEIAQEIKEDLPYTLPAGGLSVEQLKALTKNKLTEVELQTIAKKPELLKALGIDTTTLAATVAFKPIENPEFKDVEPSHWAADTIKEAAKLGIVAGRPDGSFAPSEPLQTADTFTFLDRLLLSHNMTESNLPRSTVEKYITDKDHWAFNNMASIASKLSENTLKTISELGDKPLTRELLAQTIYEITKGKLDQSKDVSAFTDTQNSAYQEAINYCVSIGLLNGTSQNTMSPQKELTRAEMMTVLIRLDKML